MITPGFRGGFMPGMGFTPGFDPRFRGGMMDSFFRGEMIVPPFSPGF
jgi:hypothetical protein